MSTRNVLDWVALGLLPGFGPVAMRRALKRFRTPGRIAYDLSQQQLASLGLRGDAPTKIVAARRTLSRDAEHEQRRAETLGLRLVLAGDEDYPAALAELPDAPILLYVRGTLSQGIVRVAVVGSRRATHYGKHVATGLAGGLAARGIEIVSGGARGIDTCAHRGALEEGGRTIAVLGSGLEHPYPPENAKLFERIAQSGAVMTEFPLNTGPRPENFPRRNRLISGLASAVIVVEANARSGTLITAGHALEQGRDVLAVPGPVTSERSVGCNRLIQQGARLVQNLEDVLDELSPIYRGAIQDPAEPVADESVAGLLPDETELLELLGDGEPLQLDTLADLAPFGFARVQAALFGLEVRGAIESLPGRYYLAARNPRRSNSGSISGSRPRNSR